MVERPARFFESAAEYRQWLEQHHADASELWIGFYKKGASKSGITYREAVDQSLCFGWIDGVANGIDEERYCQRYTPRKARSIWSAVNINRAQQLTLEGQMHPSGLAAFEARTPDRVGVYSHEQEEHGLSPAFEQRFREHVDAWAFFEAQPPSYRKPALWHVMSAKREETRVRRLEKLIEVSAAGQRLPQLVSPSKRKTE